LGGNGGMGGGLGGSGGSEAAGGLGGNGGAGGVQVCMPGTEESCYEGPSGTAGVGTCKAGTRVCVPEGTGYSECFGDVTPTAEDCSTLADEDCNGKTLGDAGCVCVPGSTESCYTGPTNTLNVSSCKSGTHACNVDGKSYSACIGEVTPSAEQCATPADESCDGQPNCTGEHIWSNRFGDANNQLVGDVAVDGAGNSVVAGTYDGSIAFGGSQLTGGNDTLFVVKFGPTGQHLWSKGTGSGSYFTLVRATTDSVGNVVLGGGFNGHPNFGGGVLSNTEKSNVFAAKLDPEGNHLWSKQFGDTDAQFASVLAVDNTGNVVLAGGFQGGLDFGGGPLNGQSFLAKLDPSGSYLWGKAFAHQGGANSAAIDGAGNIVLTGVFGGITNFGGDDLQSNDGTADIFVAKFDPNGNHVWSKQFGNADGTAATGIQIDAQGNLFLTGGFGGTINFGGGPLMASSSIDLYVAKLDAAGNHVWSKRFGGDWYTTGNDLAVDGAGNIALMGWFYGTVNFGQGFASEGPNGDIFLAKLDAVGNELWSKRFTATTDIGGSSIAVDRGGNIMLAGTLTGTTNLGGGALSGAGFWDILIGKFAP